MQSIRVSYLKTPPCSKAIWKSRRVVSEKKEIYLILEEGRKVQKGI